MIIIKEINFSLIKILNVFITYDERFFSTIYNTVGIKKHEHKKKGQINWSMALGLTANV